MAKTPKTYQFRMTAHEFTESGGFISTNLNLAGTSPRVVVEASSLAELDEKIKEFGIANAPCNVWVSCLSKPKIRGFDAWNSGATKNLFRAEAARDALNARIEQRDELLRKLSGETASV